MLLSLARPSVLLVTGTVSALAGGLLVADEAFVRGDLNRDGQVTLADASHYYDVLFLGAGPPGCLDAADVNNDGFLDPAGIGDLTLLLDWLFRTAPTMPLPGPFPLPGADPTPDGLTCLAAAAGRPPAPQRGFVLEWRTPPVLKVGQKDMVSLLLATTPRAATCASIAYRVDKVALENVRVDLQSTSVPANVIFRSLVLPSTDPDYFLLLAGAVYVVPFGGSYARASFPAAEGPVRGAPIFRVLADVRAGAPLGPRKLFTPAGKEDLWVAGSFLHGIQNEVGSPDKDLPGGSSLAIAESDNESIISDGEEFFRGDANLSFSVDISDALTTVNFLFLGHARPTCLDAADSNDDGNINIADPIFTLNFLFQGDEPPPPPGPTGECHFDLTQDGLSCVKACDEEAP